MIALNATAQYVMPMPAGFKRVMFEPTDTTNHTEIERTVLAMYHKSQAISRKGLEIGRLNLHTYTYGYSETQKPGLLGTFIPHVLPFETSRKRQLALEAFSDVSYQWPGDMHLNTVLLQTNQRRKGRNAMNKLHQAMLPIYSVNRYRDYGSSKSFVLPFYDVGILRYQFGAAQITDELRQQIQNSGRDIDTTHIQAIRFSPIRQHHTLLSGIALVDTLALEIVAMQCSGKLDLARFESSFFFKHDSIIGSMVPLSSDIAISYHYLNTHGRTEYHNRYHYLDLLPFDSIDRYHLPLDLTPYYDDVPSLGHGFEGVRPVQLPAHIDALLYHQESSKSQPQQPSSNPLKPLEEIGTTLIEGTHFGTEENRLRIYGPLDPATVGYDKLNGVTIQEKARYQRRFDNNSTIFARGEIGYAFRLKELRWKLMGEWTYRPARRGQLRIEARRSNSTFSSKFINTINDALKHEPQKINFDSLGIEYYRRYELDIRHSIELTNGLMLHTGILETHRLPVLHGIRGISKDRRDELIDTQYSDFAPYIRLEYTPRQYYWYDRGYKEYIDSPTPTISLELARAIPGVFHAESNYGRAELDIQQLIHVGRTRTLAYHAGVGKFFNRKGEYFINYHYFARSMYPERWEDDRIGGTFHLLDDYWYSSSPSYVQAHFMHETPFGMLHSMSKLSRFIIKERIYWGALWAEGKSLYNEIGYGIDNNYFNLGIFMGFKDAKYYSAGIKFRIEIGRYL